MVLKQCKQSRVFLPKHKAPQTDFVDGMEIWIATLVVVKLRVSQTYMPVRSLLDLDFRSIFWHPQHIYLQK